MRAGAFRCGVCKRLADFLILPERLCACRRHLGTITSNLLHDLDDGVEVVRIGWLITQQPDYKEPTR